MTDGTLASLASYDRVLVTGAGGFIGSHLAEALVLHDVPVRAMLRYSSRADTGNLEFVPTRIREKLEILRGDIRDPHFVQRACAGCSAVFHLAALIGIPYSYQAPSDYAATNVIGTLNVLEAARTQGLDRVIHISTSEAYGTAQSRPIAESHPLVAQSPYSATKIGADKLAESYHHSFGLPVVTVRPFNTYGPRQSARAIVPTILAQLLSGCASLRLGSLEPERDLTFVSDTVEGILTVGTCDAAIGRAVNLGTGKTQSIGDLARKCMAVVGRQVPIESEHERIRPPQSEVMALVSDNRLARSLGGWEPRVDLDQGLKHCMTFVREHQQMYRPEEYQR